MNYIKIKWGEWIATDSTMVAKIRYSHDGKYIEKYFYSEQDSNDAYNNQNECWKEGYTPLKCWNPPTRNSYVSLAAEVLSEVDCRILHRIQIEDQYIGNPEELRWAAEEVDWDEFDGPLDFLQWIVEEKCPELGHTWQNADQVLDFLEMAWDSELCFGDMHWGNIGIFDDQLVCIDFDAEHNSEALYQGTLVS